MELKLYNTYVHIPIEEYDKLKELADISEEKILQRAKELQEYEEKQDKSSSLIYICAGDDDFMLRVRPHSDFNEQLQPIASKLQWWIEERIYEMYKSNDPFRDLKKQINEEYKEKISHIRSAFLAWLLTIAMAIILISFLTFKQ